MDYNSSPVEWFLRKKNGISGLSKIGIEKIKCGALSLSLPSEKDGVVIETIDDSFFRQLAEDVPEVEEVCYPPSISVRVVSGTKDDPLPKVCSFRKLVITNVSDINPSFCHLCFNEALEAIELPEKYPYKTEDGIVYSIDMESILFYPRDRKEKEFVLPGTVKYIAKYAFKNTKHLEKLICPSEIEEIGEYAFENSSIAELAIVNGVIKESVADKHAFTGCHFVIPKEVPAYTPEEASEKLLQALRTFDQGLSGLEKKYITTLSDEIIDAFMNRMKNENDRRATIDACSFCPIMDQVPMTPKLYEAYEFIAEYKNWDKTLPDSAADFLRVRNCISEFELYRLTGHKGEVQRDEAFDVGCYITGAIPSKNVIPEEQAKEWLKSQIENAIKSGKKLFITNKSLGICCLGAEAVLELKKQYPDIKLVLIPGERYETENTGYGSYNRILRRVIYEQKPTAESLRWIPRLDAVKEKADLDYLPPFNQYYHREDIDWAVWIPDHCELIITTWKKKELNERIANRAEEKGIGIISFE